jgi:hypothetical protein
MAILVQPVDQADERFDIDDLNPTRTAGGGAVVADEDGAVPPNCRGDQRD